MSSSPTEAYYPLGFPWASYLACSKLLQLCLDSVTLRTIACQAPLSMGFSRQEYWSGLQWSD